VPVGDVLRGAVAEIEDFQRVDVTLDGEADLNGRAVVDVVHLIAELIENATVFSGPLTRVAVHGAPVSNGYQITVTDRGVGLGAAELLGQRASLRGEGSDDLGLSGMLGFRVVARLAQRFDVGIELASEQGRGTVVTVTLPAALFVADDEADDLSPSAPAEALAAPAVPVEAFAPPPCPSKRGRRPPLTRRSTRGRLSQPRSTRGRSSRRCQKPWPKFRPCWWSRFRPAAP